ncbi:DUF2892 domain-containing protein [bacterium]|nr:DUF2892 domain-containing protein [bacterium]
MSLNVGSVDKFFRVLMGVIIVMLGSFNQSWLGLIGFYPILTGLTSWCPLYRSLHISTNRDLSIRQH